MVHTAFRRKLAACTFTCLKYSLSLSVSYIDFL